MDAIFNRIAQFLNMETPADFFGVILLTCIIWYGIGLLADYGQPKE